jgi:hypothetical protein
MIEAWIGIDCGKTGGIAAVYANGGADSWHTPATVTRKKKRGKSASGKTRYSSTTEYDLKGMQDLLDSIVYPYLAMGEDVQIVIEQQRQRPGDSKQVVFQIGYGMGLWDMVCCHLGVKPVKVLPSQWKPRYVEVGATKKESLAICKKLYPNHYLPLAKDEARAEAILIADFVRRQDLGLEYPRTPEPKVRKRK